MESLLEQTGKSNNHLNEMLNTFEKEKKDKIRLANIILLEVPNHTRHHKKDID